MSKSPGLVKRPRCRLNNVPHRAWFPDRNATLREIARFLTMSNAYDTEPGHTESGKTRTAVESRQAVTGMGVRYVLVISIGAALVGMALAYYFLF
jgi:hypothetical protein